MMDIEKARYDELVAMLMQHIKEHQRFLNMLLTERAIASQPKPANPETPR